LSGPLDSAVRDDFAGLHRLDGLAETLRGACQRARELCIPPDLAAGLERVEAVLANPPEADESWRALLSELCESVRDWSREDFEAELLARSVQALPGVGPKRSAQLAARGLGTIGDLLFHLPTRYDDRRSLEAVADLDVGRHATFVAEVRSAGQTRVRMRGNFRSVLQAVVGDESGEIVLKWFRASDRLAESLVPGVRLLVTGDVRRYRFQKEMIHPDIELLGRAQDPAASSDDLATAAEPATELADVRSVVALYPTPEGVAPRTLRRLIEIALEQYSDVIGGFLPAEAVRADALPEPAAALRRVHDPGSAARVETYADFASAAHRRLVLEELYLLELGLALRRSRYASQPGIAIEGADTIVGRDLAASLPFELTAAQRRCWDEIRADLGRPTPMNRLLQGDVGSGKTAVAFLAAVAAVRSGHQVALMAPTELLAEQHTRTLEKLGQGLSAALRPRTALLSSSLSKAEALRVREGLAAGEIDLAIGTHALVQSDVAIPRLALAIIDEQHRFGVKQRAALAARGHGARVPDVLVMTATPIPRTLALTLYGDLDVSVIDELPPGRQPTRTLLLRDGEGKQVSELVRGTLDRGEQVYVVYPLVEESEKVDLRAAAESARRIAAAFPDVAVDQVHGRLSAPERAAAMARFTRGETRILVSTTVIEVGVDVAGATLMVIEHCERFGLAQLHQLRGRVGRGERPGTCVLVARGGGADSEARLRAMLETTDGFEIADADLRIRGPGEFLGTRQTGHLPDLRIADLARDTRSVARARELALASVREDPELGRQPGLRRAVEARWGDRLALIDVG
jgi:ATP-dependent DNA helicase RecG